MSLRGPWAASRLASALAICKRVRARLIVAKLDRLSRNVSFISALLDSGVEFVAADMPHANKMTLQVLAVFAEPVGIVVASLVWIIIFFTLRSILNKHG